MKRSWEDIELSETDKRLLQRVWDTFDPLPKVKSMSDARRYVQSVRDNIAFLPTDAQTAFLQDMLRYFEALAVDSPGWVLVSRWVGESILEHLTKLHPYTVKQWCLYFYYLHQSGEQPRQGTKEEFYTITSAKIGTTPGNMAKEYKEIQNNSNRLHPDSIRHLEAIRPLFNENSAGLQLLENELETIKSKGK